MEMQILNYCDTNEINSVATNSLFELAKIDWNTDTVMPNVIIKLKTENDILSDSIGSVRGGKYTLELQEADAIFDRDFVCVKQFVSANTFVREPDISESAQRVWKTIEAHDLHLNRLGYEKEIALTNSLLADLDDPEIKPSIDNLFGVPESIVRLKGSVESLQNWYRKGIEEDANKEKSIAPSIQKKNVREIINKDLMPYLKLMSDVFPDKYRDIFQVISGYIESINTKARARKTRNNNPDSESTQ